MEVYGLVSGTKCHSPDFTQLAPGHRTCLFISHLKSWGAYSLAAISSARNYSSTQAFTVLLGTHLLLGLVSACVGKVPCQGTQHLGVIQPSRRWNPRSLTCRSRTLPLSHYTPPTSAWGAYATQRFVWCKQNVFVLIRHEKFPPTGRFPLFFCVQGSFLRSVKICKENLMGYGMVLLSLEAS